MKARKGLLSYYLLVMLAPRKKKRHGDNTSSVVRAVKGEKCESVYRVALG